MSIFLLLASLDRDADNLEVLLSFLEYSPIDQLTLCSKYVKPKPLISKRYPSVSEHLPSLIYVIPWTLTRTPSSDFSVWFGLEQTIVKETTEQESLWGCKTRNMYEWSHVVLEGYKNSRRTTSILGMFLSQFNVRPYIYQPPKFRHFSTNVVQYFVIFPKNRLFTEIFAICWGLPESCGRIWGSPKRQVGCSTHQTTDHSWTNTPKSMARENWTQWNQHRYLIPCELLSTRIAAVPQKLAVGTSK